MNGREGNSCRTSTGARTGVRRGVHPGAAGALLLVCVITVWISNPSASTAAASAPPRITKTMPKPGSPSVDPAPVQKIESPASTSFYSARIQPIFDQSCVGCHGPEKSKGGLRLDSYAALARGGDGGPIIVAGAPDRSEIYRRITLPHDDDEVMPSDGKKLLSPAQHDLLARWIEAGAALEGHVPESPIPAGDSARAPSV